MSLKIVFVTRRVESVHSSNSVNVVSSFHQASHQQECYIGVLGSIRVENYLRGSFRLGECGFAKVVLIVGLCFQRFTPQSHMIY